MANKLPIAEHFHSLQGEGLFTGTLMHFVRLAGCTVGKFVLPAKGVVSKGTVGGELTPPEPISINVAPILKTGKEAWLCHTYDNRPFWCDTDFHKYEELTVEDLLKDTFEDHLCLTGGEPLVHSEDVKRLLEACRKRKVHLHLETSGTIRWTKPGSVWMTVSPKLGVLDEMIMDADEIKLLVDISFDLQKVPPLVFEHPLVYLQPINDELRLNEINIKHVMQVLKFRPQWRMSIQLHKVLGVR